MIVRGRGRECKGGHDQGTGAPDDDGDGGTYRSTQRTSAPHHHLWLSGAGSGAVVDSDPSWYTYCECGKPRTEFGINRSPLQE